MSDHSENNHSYTRLCEALEPDSAHVDLSLLEPAFVPGKQWLKPPPVEIMDRVADHLAHKISRNPNDLNSHIQRIALCHEVGDNSLVYAAVLDLFIALGNNGVSLRTRMLQKVADLLSDEQRDFLNRGLVSGVNARDKMPSSRYSRLSKGVGGDLQLVDQSFTAAPAAQYDTVEEARDLIDSGHIELAQKLLEEAMLAEPEREDVSSELLGIYRHTRHAHAMTSMMKQLGSTAFALENEWQELASAFSKQTNSGEG